MAEFGDATIEDLGDGRLKVVRADDVIGMSLELLATAGESLPVDEAGNILLAGDTAYRYRPVRFAAGQHMVDASGPCRILVCERVMADG